MDKELKKEILDILDNVTYWETCPQEYKDRINVIKKQLTIPVVVRQSEQLSECEHPFDRVSGYKVGMPYCNKCRKSL